MEKVAVTLPVRVALAQSSATFTSIEFGKEAVPLNPPDSDDTTGSRRVGVQVAPAPRDSPLAADPSGATIRKIVTYLIGAVPAAMVMLALYTPAARLVVTGWSWNATGLPAATVPVMFARLRNLVPPKLNVAP